MELKFNYQPIFLNKGSAVFPKQVVRRPLIDFEVEHKDKSQKSKALLDSGADFCILEAEIGEILGIDIKSGPEEKFGGISGIPAKAYVHQVTLKIGGHTHQARVGFSYEIAKLGFQILGQYGFFDNFVVKFDYKKQEITLKK